MWGNSEQGGVVDETFVILSHPYRRRLLFALLAETRESHTPELEYTDVFDEDTYVSLHHVHLPKLEQHGLIEWDVETHTISPGPSWAGIQPILEALKQNEATIASALRESNNT